MKMLYSFPTWSEYLSVEQQAQLIHLCGFVLPGIQELYPSVSEMNARALFTWEAKPVPCHPLGARYPTSDMLRSVHLGIHYGEHRPELKARVTC